MRMEKMCFFLGSIALGGAVEGAAITNASFESPPLADGAYADNTVPTGWTYGNYGGDGVPGTANPPAADLSPVFGENVAYLYSANGFPYLSQDLGPQTPNTTYSLSGYVGDRGGDGIARTFPASVTMNLHVGDAGVASRVASAVINSTPGDGVAAQYTTTTYTSGAAPVGNLFVTLVIDGENSNLDLATFDNLVLNQTAVPEPASLGLLGLGAAGLLGRRRG